MATKSQIPEEFLAKADREALQSMMIKIVESTKGEATKMMMRLALNAVLTVFFKYGQFGRTLLDVVATLPKTLTEKDVAEALDRAYDLCSDPSKMDEKTRLRYNLIEN